MNKKLPDFTLSTTQGEVKLSEVETPYLVVYFYPKDNTPGCTLEGQDFAKHFKKFSKLGASVYGVSRDSLKSHDKFKCQFEFPFALISDPEEKLCQHFEVMKMKKLYGKEYLGVDRSTFLFKGGKLIKEWRNVKVTGHVEEVLEAIGDAA